MRLGIPSGILLCLALPVLAAAPAPPPPQDSPPQPADLLVGDWEGAWTSNTSGSSDSLRCTVTKTDDGKYTAVFDATFWKIFRFKSTVTLTVTVDGRLWRFRGEQDLGFLAGGVYKYEGYTDGQEFYSTYDSKNDKGVFRMKRAAAK